jgi:hypothetical protein
LGCEACSAEGGDVKGSVESSDEGGRGTAHVGVGGSTTDAIVRGGPVEGMPCSLECKRVIEGCCLSLD